MKKIMIFVFSQFFINCVSFSKEIYPTPSKFIALSKVQQNENKSLTERPIDEVAGALKVEHIKPPKTAALPTGKTLPQGIYRLDMLLANTFGKDGYSSSGKFVKNGFWINRWMTGFILQYGISDTVSIGLAVPFVAMNKMGLDGNEFTANSELYKKYFNKSVETSAAFLASINQCNGATTTSACTNQILNNNLSLPASSTIVLPTGETYKIKANVPVKDQLRNLIVNSTVPQDGNTGLGDMQLGLLWNPFNEKSPLFKRPIFVSVGGGLRFPTGKFDLPMAFRQTGGDGTLLLPGGTLDAIMRWNIDYLVMEGIFLSWENYIEFSMTKPRLNRSSMINPGDFNAANPVVPVAGIPGPVNHGDGVPNVLTFERRGPRFHGFVQAEWGLGNTTRALKEWSVFVQGKYNIMSRNYLNGAPVYLFQDQFYLYDSDLHQNYGAQQAYSVVGGFKVSGLPDMFPLEAKFEYEYLFYGRNLFIAPMNLMFVLALYF